LQVRAQRQRFENSVTEMERAAESMQELIAELERRRKERASEGMSGSAFAAGRGSLPWPVRGPVLQPYGRSVHPEFKTVVVNKGVNIAAAMGTPIRSVAAGTVQYVDWLPGYGKCIIVDHGDGFYTLYAHASAIFPAEGTTVRAGEVLGEVGDTGSLNGAQLYFEIRKGKDSLDPSAWLSPSDG
jgi:murein hydrolase activator